MLTAHSTLSFPGNTNCKTWKDCLEQLFEGWGVNSSRQIKEDQNSNTTEVPVSLPWLFPLVCPKTELNTLPAGTRHWQRARRCPVALAQGAGKKTPDTQSGGNPSFFSSSLFSQAIAPKSSLGQQEPAGPELWRGRTFLWVQQNSGSKRMGPKLAIFFLSLVFLFFSIACTGDVGTDVEVHGGTE